jgi:hypothetical protein
LCLGQGGTLFSALVDKSLTLSMLEHAHRLHGVLSFLPPRLRVGERLPKVREHHPRPDACVGKRGQLEVNAIFLWNLDGLAAGLP